VKIILYYYKNAKSGARRKLIQQMRIIGKRIIRFVSARNINTSPSKKHIISIVIVLHNRTAVACSAHANLYNI